MKLITRSTQMLKNNVKKIIMNTQTFRENITYALQKGNIFFKKA